MFENAWRLERDLFYSPLMNGEDWKAVHDSYRKLLPLAGSREDLNYLIGQMLGEISNSHTYVGGGDDGDTDAAGAQRSARGGLGARCRLRPLPIRDHLSRRQHARRLSQSAGATRAERQGRAIICWRSMAAN